MNKIKTSTGDYALVDNEDYDDLMKYNWHTSGMGYVISRPSLGNNKKGIIWMHRLVNKTPVGFITDHINHNKLDNRKVNLRTVDNRLNQFNRSVNKNSPFGIRGIVRTPDRTFRVRLVKDKIKYNYGCFKSLQQAKVVAQNAFKELYGDELC